MKKFFRPFKIGALTLPNPVIYSPLAGCSDFPFRKMVARYRPGLMFCEMVKMDPLVRRDKKTLSLLDYDDSMHPIGGQICGSKAEYAAASAKIIEDLGFDVVDLNCGCPVDKVTKDGSGSGMLKTPDLIGEIVAKMVAAVSIPVTVKIRAGWDDDSINSPEVTKIVEQAGAKALFVHGRTREQAYRGPAKWDHIKACKEAASSLIVIGNGDVFSPEAAEKMLNETGCDSILVSRGTMGEPWFVEDLKRYCEGLPPIERDITFRKAALLDHYDAMLAYHPPHIAVLEMRRVACWYLKNAPGTREFRKSINHAQSVEEVKQLITGFPT